MDSTSWGVYDDSTFVKEEAYKKLVETGEYKETKSNNIYDLAGNVREWSTETILGTSNVARGGYCYAASGVHSPASNRSSTTEAFRNLGFRIALYL